MITSSKEKLPGPVKAIETLSKSKVSSKENQGKKKYSKGSLFKFLQENILSDISG